MNPIHGTDPNGRPKRIRCDINGVLLTTGSTGTTTTPTATAGLEVPNGAPFTLTAPALADTVTDAAEFTLPTAEPFATSAIVMAIEPIYFTVGKPATEPTNIDFPLNAGDQIKLTLIETLQAFRCRSQGAAAARVRVQFFGG